MAQSVEQRFRKPQVEGSSPSVGSLFRGVAQFGSAFGSGPKGRGFESRHFDTKNEATCNKASRFFVRFSQICTGMGQAVDSMGRGKLGRDGVNGLLRIG